VGERATHEAHTLIITIALSIFLSVMEKTTRRAER